MKDYPNLKLLNNNILIELDDRQDWLMDSKGNKFLHSINHVERWQHSYCWGRVVAVPESLTKDYMYGTTMELKVGDRIIFYYLAIDRSRDGETITHTKMIGDNYVIPYHFVFVAIRGKEVIPVNGWVIGEGDPEEHKTSLILPDMVKRKKSKMFCTILYKGSCNTHYTDPLYSDLEPEEDIYNIGDRVVMPAWRALPLEKEEHGLLSGKLLYRFQRKDIDCHYETFKKAVEGTEKREPVSQKEMVEALKKFRIGSTKEVAPMGVAIVHKPTTKHKRNPKNHYV